MSNLRYAIAIIGALSLLLGLSLGQIYYQHERIDQLEFNRFRQNRLQIQIPADRYHCRNALELEINPLETAHRLDETIRRYNKGLQRWEQGRRSRDRRSLFSE